MHGVQLSAKKAGGKGKFVTAQRGSLLFSHRGVTGPAVLDLSHHAVMELERQMPMPGDATSGRGFSVCPILLCTPAAQTCRSGALFRPEHRARFA